MTCCVLRHHSWKIYLKKKTHRNLVFGHILHLDVQVLYFNLHALSGLHCRSTGELWLLQLWETGRKEEVPDRLLDNLWKCYWNVVWKHHLLRHSEAFTRVAYLIFELGDLPLAGGVTLQVVQHNLCISQKDFGPPQVFLQPLLRLHIPLAHLNGKAPLFKHMLCFSLSSFRKKPPQLSRVKKAVSFQSKEVPHTKSHTLSRTDRNRRQEWWKSTWSWVLSSLDSSSLLSRNTFCLSSYSSSSCTSICFSCRTHKQACQDAQADDGR